MTAGDTEPKPPFQNWGWKDFAMLGGIATGVTSAIVAAVAYISPLLQSDPAPYASIARVEMYAQNAQRSSQETQAQQKTIADQLKATGQFAAGIALTVYAAQLQQASAQIAAATSKGQRDYAAEALKASAEQAIMSITAQQPVR